MARAVVGHDPLDGDSDAFIPDDGGFQESDGAFLFLAGHDVGEAETGVIVDADMDVFPAPRLLLWPVRSPVIRCPTLLKRPSFLMLIWIISPGLSCS